MATRQESIVFGGGCFWCTEAVFLQLQGVRAVTSGYAGGTLPSPSYEQVLTGRTGHAEVIKVDYDPDEIPFRKLLDVFFSSHDPTALNRQGADIGTQYRSIILHTTPDQRQGAEAYLEELGKSGTFSRPIVTELRPLDAFYPAEGYHQDFYAKNSDQPYAEAVIAPKLEKLKREHRELLKRQDGAGGGTGA